jgi:hypothetical protein
VASHAKCSAHFAAALALFEVRQRYQAQSPTTIRFLAGQSVKVIGLELINDELR